MAQHWVPPILVYVGGVGILFPSNGPLLGTGTIGALYLLPISAWIAMAGINSEDGSQVAISSVNARGFLRARFGIILAALSVAAVLATVSIAMAIARNVVAFSKEDAPKVLLIVAIAHAATAMFGTAVGASLSKPTIGKAGFSWVSVVLVTVLALITPGSPFRSMIAILNSPRVNDAILAGITGVAVASVAISTVVLVAGLVIARRRM